MSRILRWISITVVALLLGAALVRALGEGRKGAPAKEAGEMHAPSRVAIENGKAVVILSERAWERVGITIATLKKARRRKKTTAPAMVLATQELATLRSQYVAGENQVKKAEIAAGVDRKEYRRLKTLYSQNQNASAKALQAAQGRLRSDQADLAAARQRLVLEQATVRQSWGDVVAEWVASDSPSLERVLSQQDVLAEVTIPAGQRAVRPRTVRLEIPAGGWATANLVSAFPRVDPRIQGISLLYLAPTRPGLVPGVNPAAQYAAGRPEDGVVVPRSSVLWWQGSAWAYQEIEPGHFTRRPVSTRTPLSGGYFVTSGLAAGDKVVVQGAQMMLSTEMVSQRESAGGDD